jgi:hypothetical protein
VFAGFGFGITLTAPNGYQTQYQHILRLVFLEVYQTWHPVWYTVPNANETPTTNKTGIHVTHTIPNFQLTWPHHPNNHGGHFGC